MASKSHHLVSKKEIAARYGVSVRTITAWMRRRILPYTKLSSRLVRFDPEICDIVLQTHEHKSIFDQTIQEELGRLASTNPEAANKLQVELGVDPIKPVGGEKNPRIAPGQA